jgi:hypothetical protein
MVFNVTFNNISVISWWGGNQSTRRKPEYQEKTRVPGGNQSTRRKPEYQEKTTDLSQVTDKLSHNVVSSTPHHEWGSNSQL